MSRKRDRSKDSVNSGRRAGRPKKHEPPRVPYEELDRILVFGEIVTCEDGESTTVHYPSYRDLARRYGVSNSVIARYAKRENCLRRREVARARVTAESERKLIDARSTAIALSKEDEIRLADTYIAGFEKALAEGDVRFNDPVTFERMCRLKEYLLGGADSRQEIHAALSLEDLQARHRQMLKTIEATSAAERGELGGRTRAMLPAADRAEAAHPPASPSAPAAEEATGDMVVESAVSAVSGRFSRSHAAPSRAPRDEADHKANGGDRAPQGASVAPTGRGSGDDGHGDRRAGKEAEDEP